MNAVQSSCMSSNYGASHGSFAPVELASIVSVIGEPEFPSKIFAIMSASVGVDYCSLYRKSGCELVELGAEGALPAGQEERVRNHVRYVVNRSSMSAQETVSTETFRTVNLDGPGEGTVGQRPCEGALFSARRNKDVFSICILRGPGNDPISPPALQWLKDATEFLVAAMSRHAALTLEKPDLVPALSCLDKIEGCVSGDGSLSKREGEVCARILYGLSTCGIALDLGIGKESVMTYRKRAYARLRIASQRELLVWYLTKWSNRGIGRVGDSAKQGVA